MENYVVDKEILQKQEDKTNLFTVKCTTIICGICLLILLANELEIFIVGKSIMRCAMLLMFGLSALQWIVLYRVKKRRYLVKYIIILLVSISITILSVCLSFHAILGCVLPIMLASQYSDKKLLWYSYFLCLIGVAIGVYGGYFIGVWDYNYIIYGTPFSHEYKSDYYFRFEQFTATYASALFLYFVVPRCLIITAFIPVFHAISTSARTLTQKNELNKYIAEHDNMTGLYNRNKYLDMLNNEYNSDKEVVLFYFDVNNLKVVNDTLGHDKGDTLIKEASDSVKSVLQQGMDGYRLGGDEFLVVMEKGVQNIEHVIEKWNTSLFQINHMPDAVPCIIAYGVACGKAKNIQELLKEADAKMYEDKRRKKELGYTYTAS